MENLKATEIRIGNLFIEENSKKIIEVIGLEKNRIVFSGFFLDKWQAKPIPLAEESIGLFKNFSHTFISRFRKEITFSTRKDNICTFKQKIQHINLFCDFRRNIFYIKYGSKKIYIKNVHQLQNLYFTLTGEELTLKN
jgi:hypothetical protein